MMKRFALAALGLGAGAAAAAAFAVPADELTRLADLGSAALARGWESLTANPAPVAVAAGTFLLTVVYHKARGKSLRESVEVAATRVTVIPVPAGGPMPAEDENAAVRRAKARATRTQLVADQIALENRHRKLPEAINRAEKDVCYTEQAAADAEKALADRRKAHADAVAKLEALRKEKAEGDAELAAIAAGLRNLAGLV